jgi:hypothetical protein
VKIELREKHRGRDVPANFPGGREWSAWETAAGTEGLTAGACRRLVMDWEGSDIEDFPWLRIEYRIVEG